MTRLSDLPAADLRKALLARDEGRRQAYRVMLAQQRQRPGGLRAAWRWLDRMRAKMRGC